MRFQVPQFIERETKIFGPLTFKQFIYIGAAGLVIFVLYFTFAKLNFLIFLVISIFLAGSGLAFAFINVEGKPLSRILENLFGYMFSSRVYLWQKKGVPPQLIKIQKEKPKEKKGDDGPVLKITEKSRLKQLSTDIEIKGK